MSLGPAELLLGAVFAAVPVASVDHRGAVLGVEMGGAAAFGPETAGVGAGVTARGLVGYEIGSGLTPNLSVEGTRFGSAAGSTWEMSAIPGVRWSVAAGRVRSWIEGAAGVGQFVYENNSLNGRIEVGLRLRVAGGFDVIIDPLVAVGLHVAVNEVHVGHDDRWIDAGCGVAFAF